jgi:acetate kinase
VDAQLDVVLSINAGSSSVKGALFTFEGEPRILARGGADGTGARGAQPLLRWVDEQARGRWLRAIGHRVVHGGPNHWEPQLIAASTLDELRALIPFAPNHLPEEIALIEMFQRAHPMVPQVACFDTAFHHTLPEVARRLPIPKEYDDRGIRRYGFHGLSYAYLVEELERLAGPAAAHGRVILAHLGNGSSLAAVLNGRSIDTTMGFTPIGGVVMSSRSGDLDPGVVTYLGRTDGLSADEIETLLSKRSGLIGISQRSSDMRELLAREHDDENVHLAVESYAYSVRKAIGGFAAALGGLDTLVFSGGIGEHAPAVRARICSGLEFLGVQLDREANDSNGAVISGSGDRVMVRVVPTNEEFMIARAAWRLLSGR